METDPVPVQTRENWATSLTDLPSGVWLGRIRSDTWRLRVGAPLKQRLQALAILGAHLLLMTTIFFPNCIGGEGYDGPWELRLLPYAMLLAPVALAAVGTWVQHTRLTFRDDQLDGWSWPLPLAPPHWVAPADIEELRLICADGRRVLVQVRFAMTRDFETLYTSRNEASAVAVYRVLRAWLASLPLAPPVSFSH